jgi:nucleoside-diphosphate-sugar epimerase
VGARGWQCAPTDLDHRPRGVAGDLAKVNLGLKPEVYARLAAEVDTIVHNGALVNHAFSYRQLFEPNVLGTVEVMKLAVATRIKALTFISSVGVAGGLDHPAPMSEEEVGTKLCTEHPGDGGYALGCAAAAPGAPCSFDGGLRGRARELAGAGRPGAVGGLAWARLQWPSSRVGLQS